MSHTTGYDGDITQNSVGMTSKNILMPCAQSEMVYCPWFGLQALTA